MKKQITAVALAASMLLGVCGCTSNPQTSNSASNPQSNAPQNGGSSSQVSTGNGNQTDASVRSLFLQGQTDAYQLDFKPSVAPFTVKSDFSNVINYEKLTYYLDEPMKKMMLENGFAVQEGRYDEFFNVYEINRYDLTPNFVTTDSMMHTYHLFFSRLLKGVEKDYLYKDLTEISKIMQEQSLAQYEKLKGTTWENAAKRNVAFFSVGLCLLQGKVEIPAEVSDVVQQELRFIEGASGITDSPILKMGGSERIVSQVQEDYSQYIPRGYYTTSEELTRYFKAMMWYGRLTFRQVEEDPSRSALLMTTALKSSTAAELWDKIYTITSFFVGASDDPGINEYTQVIQKVYGGWPALDTLPEKQDEWKAFLQEISTLRAPAVNSIPIYDERIQPDKKATINGFRFMGQRTTLDAAIFQQLIYREVGENSKWERRMLPSALDIPAVLGSTAAQKILTDTGVDNFAGYTEKQKALQDYFSNPPETVWNSNLYGSWVNTLRPLLTVKGEGYPQFMQNSAWTAKNLNSFLGSWTELKHDTVLYAKQTYAEMGGGPPEESDDRGYVEPEPILYARLAALSQATSEGLKSFGVLRDEDKESLGLLAELAQKLTTISEKELKDQLLADTEYELIRSYGGQLEHFWFEALKDEKGGEEIYSTDFPAAVVTDVATDPNGSVLEVGSGNIEPIYVIVNVGGSLRITRGGVYSFYEFKQPIDERLTDEKWRLMLGIDMEFGADGQITDHSVDVPHPEWTSIFRTKLER